MLLSDNFYQNPLTPLAVEFTVKYLFPGTKMEFPSGDGDHHFPAHDLALHVGIRVVLAHIVAVGRNRLMGGKLFEPGIKVLVQAPSSSLIKTLAVMCMAFTRQRPSCTPDSRTRSAT